MTDNSDTTNNPDNFNNLQERNAQLLNDISQLQIQEKELYSNLEDQTLSSEQKQQIINKINDISQTRLNLYANMKDMYSYYQKNVTSSRDTLGEQMTAIDIIENELNQAKIRLNVLENEKNSKIRLVEINTYYGKQYNAHASIMKTIVLFCIPIIILAILANSGILPPTLYAFITGLIIVIGVFIIGYKLLDLSNRDNMNWDEYNWYFNKSDAPTDSNDGSTSSDPWATPSVTCIGSECCYQGSTYDPVQNICIPNPIYNSQTTATTATPVASSDNSTTTESFTSGKILEKYGYSHSKPMTLYNNVNPLTSSLTKFKL